MSGGGWRRAEREEGGELTTVRGATIRLKYTRRCATNTQSLIRISVCSE
eukprot:COSAG04_NODE_23189_length_342_cov_1.045267_1_plen_48_part_10